MSTTTVQTIQVNRVYIKATREAIWEAITDPSWTVKYGYGGYADFDLKPGGAFKSKADEGMLQFGAPEIIVDGEVLESTPPSKLVQTWRMLMDPTAAAEGFTQLTYEIETIEGGYSKLTVTHDLTGAPTLAALVGGEVGVPGQGGGGWDWVLSDLKTLLETGTAMSR